MDTLSNVPDSGIPVSPALRSGRAARWLVAVVMIVAGLAWFFSSSNANAEPMLNFKPGNNYEADWLKVDSLTEQGLYKSALDLSNAIFEKAKKENNAAQQVKALMYRFRLSQNFEEYSEQKAINDLRAEIAVAKFPVKPVLQSVLANLYWQYYEQHRWEFSQRSAIAGNKEDDIATWDLKTLVQHTIKEHEASLQNPDSLQIAPREVFLPVYEQGDKESAALRPTLYDFLVHRAIDFYSNEEAGVTRPAERFILDQDNYFGKADEFVKLNPANPDSLAMKYYAFRHYQQLLKFRLADKNNVDAYIDADLKRLQFVHTNSVSDLRDELFRTSLSQLAASYPSSPVSTDVMYVLARHYQSKAEPGTDASAPERGYMKKAVEICREAVARAPKSQGGLNCLALENEIARKSFTFTGETTVVPDQVSRIRTEWRNLTQMYFRIVPDKVDVNNPESFDTERERITDYLKRKPVTNWEQTFPDEGDYLTHSADIKIPALPAGDYIILASYKSDFPIDTNAIAYRQLNVSEISNVSRRMENGSEEVLVLNRRTGAPMAGVTAHVWQQEYSYINRRYVYRKVETQKTNEAGFITISARSDNGATHVVELISGKNRTLSENFYLYKSYRTPRRMDIQTFFFTDRSIYRPGQTVYFKAISIETDGNKTNLLTNREEAIVLKDANYQDVSLLQLTTNKYGSVSGSFVLPMSGITGQYHLQAAHGSSYFSVEEYKRPKFEVTTEPVKGSYRLNDKVEITGKAKTYSGAVVDNAEVQYRIVRNVSFPWWWYSWYGWGRGYNRGTEAEIASGKVTTNDTGGFVIPFTALPDRTVQRKSSPTFNYTIYIDVTDQSGETQSTTSYVNVGYKALNITIGVGEQYSMQDTAGIALTVANLMGTPEKAEVKLSVTQLEAPKRQYRSRLEQPCDKQLYTEAEWFAMFPNDPYKDEHLIRNWKQGAVVFTKTINSDKEKRVKLAGKEKWKAGTYKIEAVTTDKFGEEVKEVRYFTLFSETGKEAPEAENPFWLETLKTDCKPGEKATFLLGTTAKDVQVLYEIEHQYKIVSRQWLKMSNEQRRIEIPVEEKHRGNFAVHVLMMVNGRVHHSDQTIYVGWESKSLDIKLATFRDKMKPGAPEEWRLTVKGMNGEKMMAEMVAAMYDASLDAFRGHGWDFGVWRSYYDSHYWNTSHAATTRTASGWVGEKWYKPTSYHFREYDVLSTFGFYMGANYGYFSYREGLSLIPGHAMSVDDVMEEKESTDGDTKSLNAKPAPKAKLALTRAEPAQATTAYDAVGDKKNEDQRGAGQEQAQTGSGETTAGLQQVKARTNLGETAFFFPNLETDAEGNVVLKFTAPEALTRWRFMAFAHTTDLHYAQISREVVTQKELMVMPNVPRFLRENDKITITSKIANLSDKDLSGTAQLMLFDALSMKPVDTQMGNTAAVVNFSAKKGQSTAASWNITIPEGMGAVQYRVVAVAGNFSDGEEASLPVLTNRMLVTETMPLPINGGQNKEFRFDKLLASGKGSTTLRSHRLTLEFTSNPAWYGVQSLPYLIEFPYECAEQTFSRFYANSIATHVANSSPKIRAVFDAWKNQSPDAFLSNLEKNQELKALVLEETPWVLQANNESERKRRVGMLFEVNRMAAEQQRALRQLNKMQVSNGGWPWFEGMPDDRYITQHIITGMGHLDHLKVKSVRDDRSTWNMVTDGIRYLDARIVEDLRDIRKYDKEYLKNNHLGYLQVQYLYARSYFKDVEMDNKTKEAFDYFFGQAQKYWLQQPRYMQGMLALCLHRYDDKKTPTAIMKSLKETALTSEEMGMYWKDNAGWYWYQAPIEAQAVMIEAFDEVANDQKSVDALRVWLLKNKQTNDWRTTKATAEACYALLLRGTDLLATESDVSIVIGNMPVDPKKLDTPVEAGTGYFKTSWSGGEIKPEMGNIKVSKAGPGVSWGAVYWQYFEQLDKITPAQTPLQLKKQLYRVRNTASGPVLDAITETTVLKPGDKIRVRIELRNDRDMEYVHLKDMRASGFEPVNVLSQYKYQDGFGYYESTRDAATNFFIGWLPKGVHIFEYPLVVALAGDFSNGITSAQCMYAPEFAAHSAGIRVRVER
ncbi:MAG: MG2 domain-containing protein [Bacteroidia bacterium]|jgi:uncharacterized protein YfaS (alpha-2-macroglobulin family)|nr:MG2 domain-containing protein [Bacteroidia bacterium]